MIWRAPEEGESYGFLNFPHATVGDRQPRDDRLYTPLLDFCEQTFGTGMEINFFERHLWKQYGWAPNPDKYRWAFGEPPNRSNRSTLTFYFRTEADLVMFLMEARSQ